MMELIAALVSSIISAILSSLITRQKYQAEIKKMIAQTEGNELDNVSKAVKIWEELAEKLNVRVKELTDECLTLTKEVSGLRQENIVLKQDIQRLEQTLHKLQS